MAKTKKMDEVAFAKLVKEFNAVGELIRARQDEKQAIIDQFKSESKRFFFGRISEKTLASSVQKTNKEFRKLDTEIRRAIVRANDLATQAKRFVSAQSPKVFTAKLTGIGGGTRKKPTRRKAAKKRRAPAKRKPAKKRVVKKKRAPVKRKAVKRKPAKKRVVKRKRAPVKRKVAKRKPARKKTARKKKR